KKLGIHLEIREKPENKGRPGCVIVSSFIPKVDRTRKYVILTVNELIGETVDAFYGDEYLFTATVGRKGDIKIGKDTEAAVRIIENPSIVTLRSAIK
ncbi:MAG TPA: hypothetical protein VIO11_08680, partial [Candidatus Methanoperedens sp.]